MVGTADFEGCFDRLKWVDHALRAFDEEFRVWMLEHDPYPITVEYQAEADVHLFRLGTHPPPARFGIITGNVIHQIRATLDNLIWQLVIANSEEPTPGSRGNQFPIIGDLKENRTFADYTSNSLAGVHPDYVAVIEGLQPYHNPEWGPGLHPLALLADLSNTDKHQVLKLIMVERPQQAPFELPQRFLAPDGVAILDSGHLPATRRYPGAIVGWALLSPPGFHPDVEMEAEFWGELSFTDNLRVLGVLNTLFAVVDAVVWMFSGFVTLHEPMPVGFRLTGPVVAVLRRAVKAKRNYTFDL